MKYQNRYTGQIVEIVNSEPIPADEFDKPKTIVYTLTDRTRWDSGLFRSVFVKVVDEKYPLDKK